MKIGLLTTYSFNYGSYYQAVSLQKKLQSMGYECELINEEIKRYKWFNLFIMYAFDPILPTRIKKILANSIPQYNSYLKIRGDVSKVKVSNETSFDFKKLSRKYDCIIVGSDELWSADKSSIRFVPEYFGIGCQCPIFSYATCAIKLDVKDQNLREKIAQALKTFTAIAVRDDISKKKIGQIIPGEKIYKVLDPTLLNPFFVYKGEQIETERYVLLYGQHYSDEQINFIKRYANENQCVIKCVGWKQDWCDEFVNTESGEKLQETFAKAEFCFPSTFHGTIFSILNHKQFIAMLNPLRGKKVELLLDELKLKNRIYNEKMDWKLISNINYDEVERVLCMRREESQNYLEWALGRIKSEKNM